MQSKIKLNIEGKSLERFIIKLNKSNINIYRIDKVNKEKYEIVVKYSDYEKILDLNTIYKIYIVEYIGLVQKKKSFLKHIHIFLIIIISFVTIFIFSNIIFRVEVISNDNELKERLVTTLRQYDLAKYRFKRKYEYIQEVKEEILKKYKDSIEWIEIEQKGTKYIVKLEPKILKPKEDKNTYRHIVAKKNAVIRKIYSSDGQVIKEKNSYVKKGDIIISGYIYANDEIVNTVPAEGKVYGEVWYETKIIYPFNYYEVKKTGKVKTIFSVKLFNKSIELFNFNPFNDKIVSDNIIFKHNFLPFSLSKQTQEEVVITTEMNVVEELKVKAISLAYSKMEESIKDDEYIINYRILDSKIIASGIEMTIFFSVCEEISDYVEIVEGSEVDEKRNDEYN